MEADTGIRPPHAAEMFIDSAQDNRPVDARFKASPFVPYKDAIRGFVFNVVTGRQAERGFLGRVRVP
jgi:carbonic anhydrase